MKYLVMARAKHTAKMSYCVISQNHPTQPMSIVTVTSVSQGRRTRQRQGPVQSTAQGHTASQRLHQDSRSYLLDSRAQSLATPPTFFFFFFCLLDLYDPSVFYSKFLLVPFLFQFFIHSDYFLSFLI